METKYPRAIYIEEDGTSRLAVRLCYLSEHGKPTAYASDSSYSPEANYYLSGSGLYLRVSVWPREGKFETFTSVGYGHVMIDSLLDAERIFSTLKSIEKKLEALNAEHGRPRTFAQSVMRLASAVGARALIMDERLAVRLGRKYGIHNGYWSAKCKSTAILNGEYAWLLEKLECLPGTEAEREAAAAQ